MADPADDVLASALREDEHADLVTRAELRAATGVPDAVLAAAEREGFVAPIAGDDGAPRYAPADVDAVAAGMTLVDAGVPVGELLALARRFDTAMVTVAEEAVELFARFVRDPVLAGAASPDEAGDDLVAAFETMLPATTDVVAQRFRRLLLERAASRFAGGHGGPTA